MVRCRAARTVVRVWERVEPRKVLRSPQTTKLLAHLIVVHERSENGPTRITEAVIPDDLVAVFNELADVERCRSSGLRVRMGQEKSVLKLKLSA